MWELASLKSVGQAGQLETQTGVKVTVLNLPFVGQTRRLEIQAEFLLQSLGRIPSFPENF